MTAPNVLLLVLDTARADVLGSVNAPAVGDLARRGAAWPAVQSTSNWTLPSHVSMFTGLLPRTLDLAGGSGDRPAYLARVRATLEATRERLLPSAFREAGYRTWGRSANPWIVEASGFATGFDDFASLRPRPRRTGRRRALLDLWRSRHDDGAREAEASLRTLIADRRTPWFAFVNLMECHAPYLPPKPYDDLGPAARWKAVNEAAEYLSPAGLLKVCVGEAAVPPEALERMRHLYARSARLMDDVIGRTLQELDRARVLDETVVAVTSDHGENLGEGGLVSHTLSLDQRLCRVPLVVSSPLGAPQPAGLESLASLPRILAEAAGLESHPWTEPFAGVALAQNDGLRQSRERRAEAEARGVPPEATRRLNTPMDSATDGRRKLVRTGGEQQLFDLEADPSESRPLDASVPEADRLRAALAAAPVMSPASEGGEAPTTAESEEIERHLEALGYL